MAEVTQAQATAANGESTLQKPSSPKVNGEKSPSKPVTEETKAKPDTTVGKSETNEKDKSSDKTANTDKDLPPEEIKRPSVPATFRGWKEVSGWRESDTLTVEDELDDLLSTPTGLENYLPDVAYGDWYHNVGIFLVAGLFSWIFGHFGFSLGPVFFITTLTSVYYRTQVRRYRTNIKETTQREMSVKKMETDYETMDWLNAMLDKYWVFLEPYICQQVTDIANPIIASSIGMLPAFIQAVWIDTMTLGSKPFRVESVKTLPETSDEVLIMDWCVSFTPNDHHDLTYKQLKNRVNQKVVIKIKVFGISIPIVVKNVAFKSTVRVRIQMMESFPHIDTINISLPELPMFDFVSKVLGDSVFNWEVLAFPGLWPFIYEMITKYAGPIVLPPFSFQLNVEQLLQGDLNGASGILAVTPHEAANVKLFDRTLDNTIDPYISFSFGNTVVAKTSTLEDTKHAYWKNETLFVLVKNLSDPLRMAIYDYNDDRKDGLIGILDYDLQSLKKEPIQKNIQDHFMRNNKPVGDVKFSLKYMPVILPKRLIDGSTEPPPELNTGTVRIDVPSADLDSESPLTTSIDLIVNQKTVASSALVKKNNNPNFGITGRYVITNKAEVRVSLILKDDKGKEIDHVHTTLNDIVDRTIINKPLLNFANGTGQISASAHWGPVKMEAVSGALTYTEPIGVVKVVVNNARDLRNLETVGTIDPYLRVLVNNFVKSRTTAKDSTTNPDWNEALWIPVTSVNQKLTLEAMDTESHEDRSLGSFDLKLSDIITRDDDGNLSEYADIEPRTNRLVARKFSKGTVAYSISFFPLQEVLDPEEEKRIEVQSQKVKAKQEQEAKLTDKEKKEIEEKGKAAEELQSFDEAVPLAKPVSSFEETSKKRTTLDELVESEAGVFVFQIVGGNVKSNNSYLQFFFDASGYAEYTSGKLNSQVLRDTGDAVVKELSWSKIFIRLAENKNDNRAEDSIGSASIPTLSLLKDSYVKPVDIRLDDGSVVSIKSRFIPLVNGELPETDKIVSSGTISVDIKNAENLISADSNGKSDPFVRLFLNGDKEELFKTKTKKKTLDPTWNETCEFQISNRFYSFLKVAVYDWDFGSGQDDELGEFDFPLAEIKSDGTPTDVEIKLAGVNGVPNGGIVHLTFRFKPHYIVPVHKDENNAVLDTGKTFISGGTKLIGGGIGAVGGGIGAVGKVKNSIFGGKKKD